MEFITASELAKSKDASILVVDIRSGTKYIENHVPGSINIDVYSDIHFYNSDAARKKLSHLPKSKIIVTVCNAGVTAQPASKILESMGYKTMVLEKGMIGWNEMASGGDNH